MKISSSFAIKIKSVWEWGQGGRRTVTWLPCYALFPGTVSKGCCRVLRDGESETIAFLSMSVAYIKPYNTQGNEILDCILQICLSPYFHAFFPVLFQVACWKRSHILHIYTHYSHSQHLSTCLPGSPTVLVIMTVQQSCAIELLIASTNTPISDFFI